MNKMEENYNNFRLEIAVSTTVSNDITYVAGQLLIVERTIERQENRGPQHGSGKVGCDRRPSTLVVTRGNLYLAFNATSLEIVS